MNLLSIGISISKLRNYHIKMLNKVLKGYPIIISAPEYMLLWSIQQNPGSTQYRLSQISGYSIQRCSQMIGSLEKSHLVRVNSGDEHDKGRHIYTSDQGETAIREIYDIFGNFLREIFTEEEARIFLDVDEPLLKAVHSLQNNERLKKELRS